MSLQVEKLKLFLSSLPSFGDYDTRATFAVIRRRRLIAKRTLLMRWQACHFIPSVK